MPIAALCRHSTRQAGEIHAVGRRCQMRVSQFASLFVSFSVLLVETQQFPPHRVRARMTTKVRDAAGLHQPSFGLKPGFSGLLTAARSFIDLGSWNESSQPFCSSTSVDSTALVAGADPEVARRRVTQFFEQVSHSVITHGGIVEKFAGDAVAGCVRNSAGPRGRRRARGPRCAGDARLGRRARARGPRRRRVRARSSSTRPTRPSRRARPSTLAARLQQAAGAGEVLIGPHAYRLTSGRLQTEDVGPLDVKGFGDRIWTWRAEAVLDGAPKRAGVAAPLVGREAELELLQNTYERAVRNRRAHLFTLYGDPGVGKSRLAQEFVEGLEGATVLVGRALPYGESVTYWPLAEMVKSAAGITDDDPPRSGGREAARILRERSDRRPARARLRRAGGGEGRAESAGDRLGRARVGRADGREPAARACLRRHPLGRGRVARPDRASRRVGA